MAYGEKEPWTDASDTALSQSIAEKVPRGEIRAEALKRIAILHCARKGDTIATCSPLGRAARGRQAVAREDPSREHR
jgi:hypothetical protein